MAGTTRKRGENSRQKIFDLPQGLDAKHNQARHTVHGTKREAEAKLRQLLTAVDKGEHVGPSKESVEGFLHRRLEIYARIMTGPRTFVDYRGIVTRSLVPSLVGVRLSSLHPDHVQALYGEMLGRGLCAMTINHTHTLLPEALSHGVKWGILARNVCDAVDPPRPL